MFFVVFSQLTLGARQGFWRLRQDDKVKSEFCMVLEDRGVYNGGFNVRTPSQDPQKPFIEE